MNVCVHEHMAVARGLSYRLFMESERPAIESERRRSERHPYEVRVEIELDGEDGVATRANVSSGGMGLAMPFEVPVGELLHLRFRLPELDDVVEAEAIVRWRDRVDPRTCGVQFTAGLRAREVWAIERLGRTG